MPSKPYSTVSHAHNLVKRHQIKDYQLNQQLINLIKLLKYKGIVKMEILCGIDPGVNTGFAFYNKESKKLIEVRSAKIHMVMLEIRTYIDMIDEVFVEDARLRKWFGNSGKEQLQGAGSIKRDCSIWEDFLTDYKIDFKLIAPKNNKTKLNCAEFRSITGWTEQTNEHARDAAMLVYGR